MQLFPNLLDTQWLTPWLTRWVRPSFLRSLLAAFIAIGLLVGAKPVHAGVDTLSTTNDQRDLRRVMVELSTPPVADVYAERLVQGADVNQLAAATQARLATIDQEQTQLSTSLAQLGAHEIFRLQRVYNGIAISVDAEQFDAIRSLPGVASIRPLIPKQPNHQRSVPFVGAPALWSGEIDALGDGITIAVIDTGVDYLHANFGGSLDYDANDPTVIGDVDGFPGSVVIGGYDFVGDSYDADPENSTYDPIPQPDPDPTDCYSHGTHVAGTIAGRGVLASPRETFTGPYDRRTYELNRFEIGPGIAPNAKLYALKVFGCQGSSELTELAIEWTVDPNGDGDFSDHVDVINMSLGSSFGSVNDSTAVASENAARIGVIVVASAGNTGDVTFATGSPAIADHTISVAASRDHLSGTGQAYSAELETIVAFFSSRGPRRGDAALKPDLSAPGVSILSADQGRPGINGTLKSGTSMAAPHVAGAMALLRQLRPSWGVEELKALVMNTARLQTQPIPDLYSTVRAGSGNLNIPNALNTEVIAYNGDEPGLIGVSFGTPSVLHSASAMKNLRLQNKGDRAVTYEISYASTEDTPGVDFSWDDQFVSVPALGYATLPLQMTADADKMRHTRPSKMSDTQGRLRHWLSEESGHLMLWPVEGRFESIARPAEATDSMPGSDATSTFTYRPADSQLDYQIDLSNFLPTEIDAIQIQRGLAGVNGDVAYRITPPEPWTDLSAPITGTLTLTTSDEVHLASGALQIFIVTTKPNAGELRGQIEPNPAVLHVPLYAAPRPAAAMHSISPTLSFGTGDQAAKPLLLAGHDLLSENPPLDYASLVSLFELHYSSLIEQPDAVDFATGILDHADIQYVGVTDDFSASTNEKAGNGNVETALIYFGIATYADWSTPNEVEFSIFIDADQDGVDDYRLFNSDARRYVNRFTASDAFVSVVEDLTLDAKGGLQTLNVQPPSAVDTALFNSDVMVLPVLAGDIGLSSDNSDFAYRIESYSNEAVDAVEVTPWLDYDLNNKAIDLVSQNSGVPMFLDQDGGVINVAIEVTNYLKIGGRDLLLLHHQNVSGNRAEVVHLEFEWPFEQFFPLLRNE